MKEFFPRVVGSGTQVTVGSWISVAEIKMFHERSKKGRSSHTYGQSA